MLQNGIKPDEGLDSLLHRVDLWNRLKNMLNEVENKEDTAFRMPEYSIIQKVHTFILALVYCHLGSHSSGSTAAGRQFGSRSLQIPRQIC